MNRAFAALLPSLFLFACSSAPGRAEPGLAATPDSGVDAAPGPSCPPVIDKATCNHCLPTWTEALQIGPSACRAREAWTSRCGGYDVVTYGYTDGSETDYYDAKTGELVAATTSGSSGDACVFGSAGFTAPATCAADVVQVLCGEVQLDDGGFAYAPEAGPGDAGRD